MEILDGAREGGLGLQLAAVAEVLRKTGFAPPYVETGTRLLPRLFPEMGLRLQTGVVVIKDPRRQGVFTTPAIWNVTSDGVAVDIGVRAIARRFGIRSKLPLLVVDRQGDANFCPFVTYLPESEDVREALCPKDLESLGRLRALKAPLDLILPEARTILIALRDEAVCDRHRMIRLSVPAALRDRAAGLRHPSTECRRPQRRALANLIGRSVRVSGVIGEIRGRRRCIVDVVNAADGGRLADHLWIPCDAGESGDRLTVIGQVCRYESEHGPDFGLRGIYGVRVDPTYRAETCRRGRVELMNQPRARCRTKR